MGEVWKARDTRLDRIVAIKTVAAQFSPRFEREARMIAALNHPHICQIYDVGPDYLVMEYIEGKPLAGPLPVEQAIEYGAQVCDALAAAHRKGIVHRDLKPDNILVTKSGVKLLDFGIAHQAGKPLGMDDATMTQTLSQPGTITGTLQYMSPEQLEGKEAGAASDIFSFGCVLYEAITGQRAFEASSAASLIAAILERQPSRLNPVQPALQRILDACLAKDPDQRWQSASDLARELRWVSTPIGAATVRERSGTRKWRWAAAIAILAAIIGFAVARYFSPPAAENYEAVPLTAYPGIEASPALSPDGKLVAFTWTGPNYGATQVYVKQLDASEPLALTHGELSHGSPSWSPDGRQIALLRSVPNAPDALILVPSLGGPERVVARLPSVILNFGTCWLPAARQILLGAGDGLAAVSLDNGSSKLLTKPPPGSIDGYPALSPDGRTVAFARTSSVANAPSQIFIIPLNAKQEPGTPKPVATVRGLSAMAWAPDGKSILIALQRNYDGRLARLRLPDGKLEPFAAGLTGATGISVASGAKRIVVALSQQDTDIWRLPGPKWPAGDKAPEPERLIASTYDDVSPTYSPDGKRIAFESARTGNQEIWSVDSNGRDAVQVTNFAGPTVGTPRWSPDGTKIAFDSRKYENADIFVIGANGGEAVRITSEPSDEILPAWSSDGKWIFFISNRTGQHEIWKAPAGGGPAVQVTRDGAFNLRSVPGEPWLYYRGPNTTLFRMAQDGGKPEKLIEGLWGRNWSPFGNQLLIYDNAGLYVVNAGGHGALLRAMPAPASPRFLRTSGIDVSPDGRWVALSLTALDRGDLVLLEEVR
jgi:Tol biopolymer transport system component/predicted Ser/Thr protein kinase